MPGFKDIFRRFTRRSGDSPQDPALSDRTELNPRSDEFIHDPGSSVIDQVSHGDSSRAVNVPDERAVFPDRISQLQPSVDPAAAGPQIPNNAGALATNATNCHPSHRRPGNRAGLHCCRRQKFTERSCGGRPRGVCWFKPNRSAGCRRRRCAIPRPPVTGMPLLRPAGSKGWRTL